MAKELAPLPESVEALPEPREFKRLLQEKLEAEILRLRQERGDVQQREDTFQLVRGLAGYIDLATEYRRAFDSTAKIAKQELENELIDAVGEHDGTPLEGMVIPDLDGTDIRLALDQANSYDIDADALRAAVAAEVMAVGDVLENVQQLAVAAALEEGGTESRDKLETYLGGALVQALERMLDLGKFEPQVTKVRAFAKELAGTGADSMAATVSAAVQQRKQYRGVKVAREERKR